MPSDLSTAKVYSVDIDETAWLMGSIGCGVMVYIALLMFGRIWAQGINCKQLADKLTNRTRIIKRNYKVQNDPIVTQAT